MFYFVVVAAVVVVCVHRCCSCFKPIPSRIFCCKLGVRNVLSTTIQFATKRDQFNSRLVRFHAQTS